MPDYGLSRRHEDPKTTKSLFEKEFFVLFVTFVSS